MSNNFAFKSLTNCYPVQKTLRFKLIPQGKTLEHIKNGGFLERDEKRYQDSKIVQGFIDDLCREFIEKALEQVGIDNWEELEKLNNEKASKDKVDKEKSKLRSSMLKRFEDFSKENYEFKVGSENKNLFGEIVNGKTTFVTNFLPQWMNKHGYEEGGIQLAKKFNGFTGYFNTFMQNRQNMFTVKGEATSVFTRAVDDNFTRFLNNKRKLQEVEKNEVSLRELDGFCNDLIDANSYSKWLSPNGITFYNEQIGKVNSQLNELKQKGVINKKIKLDVLYKQILCEGESSFKIEKIENDGELASALNLICELWFKESDGEEFFSKNVIESIEDGFDDIKIESKKVGDFSKVLFGNRNSLFVEEEDQDKTVSLHHLIEDYNSASDKNVDIASILKSLNDKLGKLKEEVDGRRPAVTDIASEYSDSEGKELIKDNGKIEQIKDFLDKLKEYESTVRIFENKTDNVDGIDFYIELDGVLKKFKEFDKLYNQIRSYLTQKPYSIDKIPMKFEKGTILNGWAINNEKSQYIASILRKDGNYFLAIYNCKKKPRPDLNNLNQDDSESYYEKLVYNQIADPKKDIPRRYFSAKYKHNAPSDLERLYKCDKGKDTKQKSYNKNNEALAKYLDYYIESINKDDDYQAWYDFNFKNATAYNSMSEFNNYVAKQAYYMRFIEISSEEVDALVDEGRLFLFKIYNKDYSQYATGSKNLHTLYWEELFGEGNLNGGYPIKLNGGASLFYRERSIESPIVHKEGELLINKTYEVDGVWKSISDDDYVKAQEIARSKKSIKEVQEILSNEFADGDKFVVKKCKHDIIKDKRYADDHFQFHVPITLNRCPKDQKINQSVLETIKKRDDITFLGIDRGERHLLYLTLVDSKGNIKFQRTMNLVPCNRGDKIIEMDYRSKLDNKAKVREEARKSWKQIGNIKDLKQGYLSQVVHEIAKIVVENNAVIVMEDLNLGFKRGRQKFEKQVYQKFEKQLIDKLSYLSFKPGTGIDPYAPGGIANGLQLCEQVEKLGDIKGQVGIIFYVRPWNTSHVDPTTGFMNLFQLGKIKSGKKWKEFFEHFDGIAYDEDNECFRFDFNYKNFVSVKDFTNRWSVYTQGKRLVNNKDDSGNWSSKEIDVTEKLKSLLDDAGIRWNEGNDLLDELQKLEPNGWTELGWLFKVTCNLRNSEIGTDVDYILSPVKNSDGEFFDSRVANERQPKDADANGAYHIALKGLQLVDEGINEGKEGKLSVKSLKNTDWNRWIQEFHKS